MGKRKAAEGSHPGGAISPEERQKYRAALVQWGSDAKWGRPTERTARVVWELLKNQLPYTLKDLLPKSKSKKSPLPEEILTAKQSLVVALDCAVSAPGQRKISHSGERKGRGAMLTFNRLFDALAKRWSISYREARPTKISWDMAPTTLRRAYHELRFVVNVDELYRLVMYAWDRSKVGTKNPLYSVHGNARRWVSVQHDSDTLKKFDLAVLADRQYRRHVVRRLLFAKDWKDRRKRPVRQKVCAETPYNVVNLGEDSERILRLLEEAQLRFDVGRFRKDYEQAAQEQPRTNKLDAFKEGYRSIYLATERMSGVHLIRSRFFRAVNRRYHAANLWPENVPDRYRNRWFGVGSVLYNLVAHRMSELPYPSQPLFVQKDISSSQTQTLAIFLGLDELERLARSTSPKFKVWLAEQAWALHKATSDELLEGYDGPDDPLLIEFIKTTWMRYLYGSPFDIIAKKLGKEPEKYGLGWKTTRGLAAKAIRTKKAGGPCPSGAQEAKAKAETFFDSLPTWRLTLKKYLDACRTLGSINGGVVFHDPWDEAKVRWNPALRARNWEPVGKYHIGVRRWGVLKKVQKLNLETGEPVRDSDGKLVKIRKFEERSTGTIDQDDLRRMVAPCLIHTLDAFFSSLVIERLAEVGIRDFVAVHDGWYVPTSFVSTLAAEHPDDVVIGSGEVALNYAIEEAGKPWLGGLFRIYDALDGYLGQDPTYGPFVKDIREKWDVRRRRGDWPKFTTAPDNSAL
jgi:hypothetical protein